MKLPFLAILLCISVGYSHQQAFNCYVPADILVLLDGSDSIQDREWTNAKEFVKQLVRQFDIAPDAIHMGLIVYSSNIGDHISFSPFKQKTMLEILATSLRHPKQSTNTAKGIEYARDQFKKHGRVGVPKILIVITDGSSDSPRDTKSQAELAKIEGLRILAVGVGEQVFKDELRQVASSPRKVFTATSYITLQGLVSEIRNMVCQVITTTTTSTTPRPMPTHPTITVPVPKDRLCDVPGDIVFLIDGSDSINDQDFRRQKGFVVNMIDNFEIGKESIHVGIVVFSTVIGDTIGLQSSRSKDLLKVLTNNLRHPKVGTNTALGIERVRKMMREEGRSFAPKIMVVITDGKSASPALTALQASLAKAEGLTVIAVGVGSAIFRDELENIATNQNKIFQVTNFKDLELIINSMRELICQSITTTTSTTTTTAAPITITLPPVITTTQPVEITTPSMPPPVIYPPIPGCDIPAEIIILTHGSENINEYNWNMNKDFMTSLIRNLFVGQSSHHIGMVVFGSSIGDYIGIDPFKSTFDLVNSANALIHPGIGANTAQGLKKLGEILQTGTRANAPRIGLIITDQTSTDTDATRNQAEQLKKDGVHLMSIGVGNNISPRELQRLSSAERHIQRVDNFDGLKRILPKIRQQICEVIMKPTDPLTDLCSGCLTDAAAGFNPYPSDCNLYVQCWRDQNRVMGTVKSCSFGQFWDRNALVCKPSISVECPADVCQHSPDGFTYGMKSQGCRAYWLCVNGRSVGSCCAEGTYYVEGMGCLRGMACKEPCPPDGGILVTPDCSKEEHWDERYYVEKVPYYGRVVRPCPPGTVYSTSYCDCVVNINGLIPILPGDKCRPSAHLNFDVDMKDKTGEQVPISYVNVDKTIYGTARFTGNSEINLWKNRNVDFSNQLVIRFKFKFDRWTDRIDSSGVIVDMRKGIGKEWIYDTQSGWNINSTYGGGWDIQNLVKLFRSLINARTEPEMQQNMWKIANSMDFKDLLYQLGFVPDTSNGMQILRLLLNGNGANIMREIITALEKQPTAYGMRITLKQLLSRPEMRTWILQNTGKEHIDITMKIFNRFLESLLVPEDKLKTGEYHWLPQVDNIGTGTLSPLAIIADLWRPFVRMMGMDGPEFENFLRITLGNDVIGDGGRIDIEFINEMKNVLGRNSTISRIWHDFLKGKNVNLMLNNGNPIVAWWEKIFGNGHSANNIPGIDSSQSVGSISDLWRTFMQQEQLPFDIWGPKLVWTLGGPDATVDDLFTEIKNVLSDDNMNNKWKIFTHGHYSSTGPGTTESRLFPPGQKGKLLWDIIFGNRYHTQPSGGQSTVAINKLADLWLQFLKTMNLRGPQYDNLFTFSNTHQPGSMNVDVKGLLHEIKSIVMSDDNVDTAWLKFLQDNGVDIDWFLRIVLSEQGGPFDENWVYWYLYRNKVYDRIRVQPSVNVSVTDMSKIKEIWRKFIAQSKLGPAWNGLLVWTFGSGKNGGPGEYMEWIYEVISVLSNPEMRRRWINFLSSNNVGNEWINWFLVISGDSDTSTGGSVVDNSGLSTIMNLWKKFIATLNLSGLNLNKILIWTLGGGLTERYIDWSNEVSTVLQNVTLRDMWFKFLRQNNVGGVWINWFRIILEGRSTSGTAGNWNWHYISTGMTVPTDVLANLWIQFVFDRNLGYGQWADSLWWTLNVIPGAISTDEYVHLFNEMTILMMDEYIRNAWVAFLHGHDITASLGSVGGGAGLTGGSSSSESIDAILNSLTTGTGGRSHSSSSGGTDFFWPVDWDLDGFASRKKRSVKRRKRAAHNEMTHVPLLSNCGPNLQPSILVTANEQNVKIGLLTDGQTGLTELEIPLIQGWNEVTVVYDGRNLHGTVRNYKGKQNRKKPLTGNVVQRPGLTFGACDNIPKFKGQLDDIVIYKCVPEALKKELP